MKIISVDELITQKILPFDLYNEDGEKIFNAGEVLTPGKLLQLRYISVLYREEFVDEDEEEFAEESEEYIDDEDFEEDKTEKKRPSSRIKEDYDSPVKTKEEKQRSLETEFENEICCIPVKIQKDIKSTYKKAMDASLKEGVIPNSTLYVDARDRIVDEIMPMMDDVLYKSQLKVYGDYDYSHGVNVSIFSTALAYKLKFNDTQIRDIALAAMLHDVGKTRIPKDILDKNPLSVKETKLVQLHPQIGYKIIKKEMGLPDHIAKVALEHHERNDGSGYPYGISGDWISIPSQIIIVCDVYDALTSNRGHIRVKNAKEAMKAMMEIGSKWFMPNILYTFIHMSSYNDTTPLI